MWLICEYSWSFPYILDTKKRLAIFLPGKPKQPYENLDDDEKENIKTILYIMDRFSISLEGNFDDNN